MYKPANLCWQRNYKYMNIHNTIIWILNCGSCRNWIALVNMNDPELWWLGNTLLPFLACHHASDLFHREHGSLTPRWWTRFTLLEARPSSVISLLLMDHPLVSLDRRHSARVSSQPIILFMDRIPLFGGTSIHMKHGLRTRNRGSKNWTNSDIKRNKK
jgi:hypothetical protein